jgi:DNA-directed RNA polymerase subunit RPC12/RpoP
MSDLLAKCEVCGSLVDEEDLFCANCGTEAPKSEDQDEARDDTTRLTTCNFQCQGCGASMSYDAKAQGLRCPFCGSGDMQKKQDEKALAPRRVVPFRLDRNEAEAAMREWLGRGFWRPGKLASEAAIVEMTPVYVPYWVFRAKTHTYWTADTSNTPSGARGDWFPLSGEYREEYSGLLIGASGALTAGETASIHPFDLGQGKPPEEVDLENVTVERFSLQRKYARPIARQGIDHRIQLDVDQHHVPGRSRNIHANVRVESMSSEPMLLPVWIMAYRFQDKLYRFLINGQTGKAAGQAPTSFGKIALVAGAVCLGALLLLLLIGAIAGS